ncbi:MAG: squalene/phytoene synthase family protein, partial [Alphaproteobacteria bacterium]
MAGSEMTGRIAAADDNESGGDARQLIDANKENFPVGSFFIARQFRPHVHAFYVFARSADDIADAPDLAAEEKVARLE